MKKSGQLILEITLKTNNSQCYTLLRRLSPNWMLVYLWLIVTTFKVEPLFHLLTH